MNNLHNMLSPSMLDFATNIGGRDAHLYAVDSNQFYMGTIGSTSTADGITLLFMIPEVRYLLRTTKCFLLDGTFNMIPSFNNECQQLYVLMGVVFSTAFPLAFALMSSKTEQSYVALFQQIKMLEPEWKPDVLIADFESASTSALKYMFPRAQIHGCWFLYCKAIWTEVENLGMTDLCREHQKAYGIVLMLMALPFLQVEKHIFEGCIAIKCHYAKHVKILLNNDEHQKFQRLFDYYRTTWIDGNNAKILPIYKYESRYGYALPIDCSAWRTNYVIEDFHNKLTRKMEVFNWNSNSNIQPYAFIDGLIRFSNDVLDDFYKTFEDGLIISGWQLSEWRNNERKVEYSTSYLNDGTYTVKRFLISVLPVVPNIGVSRYFFYPPQLTIPVMSEESQLEARPDFTPTIFTPEQRSMLNGILRLRGQPLLRPNIRRVRQNEISFNAVIEEWCIICRSCPNPNVVFMNCMHQGMCEACFQNYLLIMPVYENEPYYRCQICRSEVVEYIIIQ